MMAEDVTVASSATTDSAPAVPAVEQAVRAGDVLAYREARRAERAGTPLEPAATVEDTASSEPGKQAGSTDSSAAPASEPGKAGHKGNLQTRKAELSAEVAELQDTLRIRKQLRDELVRMGAPVESAKPVSAPAAVEGPREPKIEDFADADDPYAAWTDAKIEYRANLAIEKRLAEAQARDQQTAAARAFEAKRTSFQERVETARAADPDLDARVQVALFDFLPTSALPLGAPLAPQNDLAEAVFQSEQPVALMAHLSDHPEVYRTLMSSASPSQFWRLVGQIEGTLAAPARVAPKTVTDAPPPPRVVGTRTEPTDDIDQAVGSGDVEAFRAAKLRRKVATMR